jgi:hypothetical protein
MSGYQPSFDHDLERGRVGESLLATFLGDLVEGAKFEVKTDYRAKDTGNFYIEIQQFNWSDESDLKDSGIRTTEADWWVFAGPNGKGFISIRTSDLRDLIEDTNPRLAKQPITNDHTNGSYGYLVKVTDVIKKIGLE